MASNPRMSGCSLKIRSRSQASFPLQKARELLVFWETFQVALRIAFSGSAATSKELKRRCASYVVSARGQLTRTLRCNSAASRSIVSWAFSSVGARSIRQRPRKGRPRPASRACAIAANYGSALSLAHSARNAASVIRERLTHQTWALIGRLEVALKPTRDRRPSAGEIVDLADEALTTIAALSGLFDENFNRGAGWVFYEMGRCVERGANTCRLLRQFAAHDATEHSLGVMLDLIDFADHLPLEIPRRHGAGACPRHGFAGSVQSTIRCISGQSH